MTGRRLPSQRRLSLACTAAAVSISVIAHAQSPRLDQFVGRDLWKQRPSKSEREYLNDLVGSLPASGGVEMEPAPWHVWKATRDGQTRYIILLGAPEFIVPGGSSACVQVFDPLAKKLSSWSFQTGHRITFVDASIEHSSPLATDLIVLHMSRFINGRNIAKEYFALDHDRLRLIRLEDDQGKLTQNEYVFPNYEIGLVPDAKTVEEWARLLESGDKSDVLSALIFLGGRHLDGPDRGYGGGPGPLESKYAALFLQVIASPRIHDIIERLTNSDDEWIKEAAGLAAREPRARPFW